MWIKSKAFKGFCLVTLKYDCLKCALFITILSKGCVLSEMAMVNMSEQHASHFAKTIDEKDVKQIIESNTQVI